MDRRFRHEMTENNEYQKRFRYLSSLYQERISVDDLEIDMTTTLKEIHNHIKVACTLDAQLTHHMLSTTGASFTGGELVLYTARLWKTATYAKEELLNFTQRYMMFDSIYRLRVDSGRISEKRRKEWLEDKEHDTNLLASKVQHNLTRLDNNISDIEYEMTQAEKRVIEDKVQNKEPFISVFNKTIEKLEQKLDGIASRLIPSTKQVEHPPAEKRRPSQSSSDGLRASKIQAISDEEYMSNLIEENKDEEASPERAAERRNSSESGIAEHETTRHRDSIESGDAVREKATKHKNSVENKVTERERVAERERVVEHKSSKESRVAERERAAEPTSSNDSGVAGRKRAMERKGSNESERRRAEQEQHIRQLEKELDELYEGRYLLPQRKIGEACRVEPWVRCAFCDQNGDHYSDSCPRITHGEERYNFIRDRNLCQYCLEDCSRFRECKNLNKPCWYCKVVEPTRLRFLIYDDGGHHRALCNIPNSRDRITEKIKAVKQQIAEARRLH